MIVGITGSIATGKSTVVNYLLKLGYKVVDSDKIVHDLYLEQATINEIEQAFGKDVISHRRIDRNRLGEIVFNNNEKIRLLNSIIHPKVIDKIKEEIKSYVNNRFDIIFVDIPLLFEENLEYLVDKIILVYLDKNKQLERLMKRDNIDKEYAIKKIAAGMNIEIKKEKSDFIIDNSYDLIYTYNEVDRVLRRIRNEI